jgi:signal transduction histidine kinase
MGGVSREFAMEGGGVLKRRSIRTKLIVAVALLSATVALLASSGFWGLYRYKQLANAVSQRALEIPYANDLNRLAMALRESHLRTSRLHAEDGMIDRSPLEDPLINVAIFEREQFLHTLIRFSLQLQLYEDTLTVTSPQSALLIDDALQRRQVRDLRLTFDALDTFYHQSPPIDHARKLELGKQLDTLASKTGEHLTLIHGGMAEFSSDVRGQYRGWIAVAWTCTVIALLMVTALIWFFHSLVVKPFNTLLMGARLVVESNFAPEIDLGTGDELSELAQAMNGMTKRFQASLANLDSANQKLDLMNRELDRQVQQRTREVIQNEQLASVGFLAAGVAHEINNPLAAIAWSAESLISRVSENAMIPAGERICDDELCEALRANLQRIEEEAYRCKGITEKLLDFSRLSEIRRAPTDLVELVGDVVTMVTKVGKYKCKTIRIHGCESMIAEVNPQEIRQVVLNLVTNALESVDTDGAVDVTVGQSGSQATIRVKDNGCGMTSEVLQHLFEPFFTRRRDGMGTGLGLSITYRIVCQHGGSLVAFSDGEGCGSEMKIELPISSATHNKPCQPSLQQGIRYESSKAA